MDGPRIAMDAAMRFIPKWRSSIHLFTAVVALGGCASRSSIPSNESSVDIQASTTATIDVKFIEIIVHQLSDGSLVYDSGIQPSSDFQDTRQHLEEEVALQGATDFTFDANAFDVNKTFLKAGNQVQEATQPAGQSTSVLIVIDLNSGDTNPTAETDITAVTDNIPVIYPPTLTSSSGVFTLHYKATDIDQSADGGPIDSNETLTFFSSVLAGNVDLSSNTLPGLFTEGPDFNFAFLDSQPVKILSAVVDRLNQLTFAITEIDPTTGAFQTVEYGEGYALFDGNTLTPTPKKAHDRSTGDPTGPYNGPIAVAVLKHGVPGPGTTRANSFSVEAISRSDDSLVVTPNNVAFWNEGAVQSFNRYEEQPDSSGTIVIDFKLRVMVAAVNGTIFTTFPPVDPQPSTVIDSIKFVSDGNNHFVFAQQVQEQAILPTPDITGLSPTSAGPGDSVEVDGSYFTGSYDIYAAGFPNSANDQRQIYLQIADPVTGEDYGYPVVSNVASDGSSVNIVIPQGLGAGAYDVVVCTFGRLCSVMQGALQVTDTPPVFVHINEQGADIQGAPVDFFTYRCDDPSATPPCHNVVLTDVNGIASHHVAGNTIVTAGYYDGGNNYALTSFFSVVQGDSLTVSDALTVAPPTAPSVPDSGIPDEGTMTEADSNLGDYFVTAPCEGGFYQELVDPSMTDPEDPSQSLIFNGGFYPGCTYPNGDNTPVFDGFAFHLGPSGDIDEVAALPGNPVGETLDFDDWQPASDTVFYSDAIPDSWDCNLVADHGDWYDVPLGFLPGGRYDQELDTIMSFPGGHRYESVDTVLYQPENYRFGKELVPSAPLSVDTSEVTPFLTDFEFPFPRSATQPTFVYNADHSVASLNGAIFHMFWNMNDDAHDRTDNLSWTIIMPAPPDPTPDPNTGLYGYTVTAPELPPSMSSFISPTGDLSSALIIIDNAMYLNSSRFDPSDAYDGMINQYPYILSYEYLFNGAAGSEVPEYDAPPGPYVEFASYSSGANNNSRVLHHKAPPKHPPSKHQAPQARATRR